MQLSIPTHAPAELAFKVNIAGTSMKPQAVSVVLERDKKQLAFPASENGDEWKAEINHVGGTFAAGPASLSITVLLNNKLYVPVKTEVEIIDEVAVDADVPPVEISTTDVATQQCTPVGAITAIQPIGTQVVMPAIMPEEAAKPPVSDEPAAKPFEKIMEKKLATRKLKPVSAPHVSAPKSGLLKSVEKPVKRAQVIEAAPAPAVRVNKTLFKITKKGIVTR